jgi:hypothetical protein
MKRSRIIIALLFALAGSVYIAAQTDQSGRWINGFMESWFFQSDNYPEEETVVFQIRWLPSNGW